MITHRSTGKVARVKMLLISSVLVTSLVLNLSGCWESETEKKINTFLQECNFLQYNDKKGVHEAKKIKGGSKKEIEEQLFKILKDEKYGHVIKRNEIHRLCANLIVETGMYGTAKKLISDLYYENSNSCYQLLSRIAIMTECVSKKTPEAVEFLNLFFKIRSFDCADAGFSPSFLKFYIKSPNSDIIDKFYPEKVSNIHKEGTLEHAIVKLSSKELQNVILGHYKIPDIRKALPLVEFKKILEDFKPSNPQKGGYLFVFDNTPHKLNSDHYSTVTEMNMRYFNKHLGYETEILHLVSNPDNAQIIIYETYSYEKDNAWSGNVFLRHTNVQVVNATTKETIFNKTFKTFLRGRDVIVYTPPYALYDAYRSGSFAKQISEIVKRNL